MWTSKNLKGGKTKTTGIPGASATTRESISSSWFNSSGRNTEQGQSQPHEQLLRDTPGLPVSPKCVPGPVLLDLTLNGIAGQLPLVGARDIRSSPDVRGVAKGEGDVAPLEFDFLDRRFINAHAAVHIAAVSDRARQPPGLQVDLQSFFRAHLVLGLGIDHRHFPCPGWTEGAGFRCYHVV
jgi:hypothetical protein